MIDSEFILSTRSGDRFPRSFDPTGNHGAMPLGHNLSTRLMPLGHKVNVYGIDFYLKDFYRN